MSNQTITVNGIILKEIKTKESDKVLTVLTGELGVISIYAKGAMRFKNKFHSSTSLFTYSEFVIFEGNGTKLFQLNEANIKKVFYGLSTSVESLALAYYMSELVCEISVPDEMTKDILRLFLNMLYMVTENKWTVHLAKAAFEMRLMSEIGYRPNLIGCKKCNKYENDVFFFDTENGEIVCPSCKKEYDKGYIICEPSVTMALRYIAYADLEKMFSFNLSGYSLIFLKKICEKYVLQHTKDSYKTLDFLNTLINEEDILN